MVRKADFGKITKKNLSKPKNMEDFLNNNHSNEIEERGIKSETITKIDDLDPKKTEPTTVYLEEEAIDAIDLIKMDLRRHKKKKISRSKIINEMILYCKKIYDRDKDDKSEIIETIFHL